MTGWLAGYLQQLINNKGEGRIPEYESKTKVNNNNSKNNSGKNVSKKIFSFIFGFHEEKKIFEKSVFFVLFMECGYNTWCGYTCVT